MINVDKITKEQVEATTALVSKFLTTPGYCTIEEVKQVKDFLLIYKTFRDVYRTAHGCDPTGLTLESNLDTVDWYMGYHKTCAENRK